MLMAIHSQLDACVSRNPPVYVRNTRLHVKYIKNITTERESGLLACDLTTHAMRMQATKVTYQHTSRVTFLTY